MTTLNVLLLLLLLIFSSTSPLLLVSAATSKNTCHSTLYKERPSTSCTNIIIPQGMCVECKVDDFLSDGQFADCSSTFNLNPLTCISKLQEYVNLNPCDTHRKDALDKIRGNQGWDKFEEGRQVMDFMVYALCEGGCDCIPQVNANRNVPAISMERGNCQVHYFSDLCTIYPSIKVVHAQGQIPTGSNTWGEVCPLLTNFVQSSAAAGWPTNPNVSVATNVRRFMNALLQATEILNPIVYQYCFDLETAQDRVIGLAVPSISPKPTPPPVTGQPSSSATMYPTIQIPYRSTYEPLVRINCGYTKDYTDIFGQYWSQDVGFNTGKRYVASGAVIPRAMDSFIYKSDRWDPPGDLILKYTVNIDPTASSYLIRLHFCELFFPNILSRIFGVTINGIKVLDGLDVVEEAKGWFQPLIKEFVITTTPNNKIEILFNPILENPKVNGIEVYQSFGGGIASVPTPKPVVAPVPKPAPIPLPQPAPIPAPWPVVAPVPIPVVAPAPQPVVVAPAPQPVVVPPTPIGHWTQLYTTIAPLVNVDNCFVMANNGRAYSIGGRTRKRVCEFNPQISDWKCNKAYPPVIMHHMQCVVIANEIWVPNSWTGKTNNYEKTNDLMYIYNTQTNTWRNLPGLPDGRRRGSAASVYHNGYIYIIGGNYGGHGEHATSVPWFDRYEVSTSTWTKLIDANKARDHAGAGIVDNGNLLCIAGGRDGGQSDMFERNIERTDCYSFATQTWILKDRIPVPRASSAYGTSCDGKLIVAGGEGNGQAYKDVNAFDGYSWTILPALKQRRTSTGLAVNCDCGGMELYIANGSNLQSKWNTTRPMEKLVLKAQGSCQLVVVMEEQQVEQSVSRLLSTQSLLPETIPSETFASEL